MKMREIAEMSAGELRNALEDSLEELQNLRFRHAIRQLDNPLRIRMVRRDIARIRTVLHEIDEGARKPIGEAQA